MKIVLPGGSGQVGTVLARSFHEQGHELVVLSRRPAKAPWRVESWDGKTLGQWAAEVDGADVVINLAGRLMGRASYRRPQPFMKPRITILKTVLFAVILMQSACSQSQLPPNWQKQIPGTYRNSIGAFTEQTTFSEDGTYTHQLMVNTESIRKEYGSWAKGSDQFKIHLTPQGDGYFTEYYDQRSNTLNTNGTPFVAYVYYPLPEKGGFEKITASIEAKFVLHRDPSKP